MEGQEGDSKQPNRFKKIIVRVRKVFDNKVSPPPEQNPNFIFREPLELPEYDLDAIKRSMDIAKRLVSGMPKSTETAPLSFTSEGKVYFADTSELILGQEKLNLSDVKSGDVVWWRDVKGNSGYYSIVDPYDIKPGTGKEWIFGKGVMRVELSNGDTIEANNATIQGAGYDSVVAGNIAKNLPIIFVTEHNKPGHITMTEEVVDFGVIKAESLK